MKLIFTFSILLIGTVAFSQDFKEKEFKTEIKEVTVFLSGAQIFESGSILIPAGNTILKVKNLSPFLDGKSVRVKADGDFTILAVNHKINHLNELRKDTRIDSVKKAIEGLEFLISKDESRMVVLKEKQSVLDENKKIGSQNVAVTVTQLKQTIDLFESEVSKIKEEEIHLVKSIEVKRRGRDKLVLQLSTLNDLKSSPTSELEIRVNADTPVTTKLDLTYLVSNAGWFPKYDIRVQSIKKPLELTYKAEVFQNTGVDWKNVKLRFSNGDPNQSGLIPELNTWNLNFARYTVVDKSGYVLAANSISRVKGRVLDEDGKPLPGVNVIAKGSTNGTVTDAEGFYSMTLPDGSQQLVFSFIGLQTKEVAVTRSEMNLQMAADVTQLSEVVVTAYGVGGASGETYGREGEREKSRPIITTMIENQTTVQIEVATPYSIKSNGDKLMVELKKHEIDAMYQYYAIPKLDKDAFLMAKITQWDQYNLLEGEANLYFEDAYIGRSLLNAKSLQDTLNISLGRDRSIVIGRVKNEQFTKRKTIGSNTVDTRGFKITVRNKKSQAIKLTLFDQIPVSVVSDISVTPVEITKGIFNEKTGKVSWDLVIDPQQQKEINLQYEVKYPKRERVILE
ncbi:membrane protein [Cytophagales bacterium WSM2-2]|nr:membrane protein [Cytophagales bacterium WSM2-2]